MKKVLIWSLPLFLMIAGSAYWYLNIVESDELQKLTSLEKTGDECSFIAEKAAMPLPEGLPFQKLEKNARKARVLNSCMQDRAYIENPVWVKYAQPVAHKNAEKQHVSYDEAYESLRRNAMSVFKESNGVPVYWVTSKTAS